MICIRLLDRTSETCKYLKDFSERSPSHTDVCINPKDECLPDVVAIELQCAPYVLINQNHALFPEWSGDHEMTSKTQCSNEMQSN